MLLAILLKQTKALEVRLAQTEIPAGQLIGHQRTRQCVIAVDHHLARATEDAVLGQVISRQISVAIHMVFADIQAGRHLGIQLIGGFQLEARQLHDVQLDLIIQQVQRRGTEVTAHSNLLAGCGSHFTDQSGHSALGVGAGDGDDRRLGITGEQVNIARQFHTTGSGGLQRRGRDSQARADQQLAGAAKELHIQFATTHFHLRKLLTQGGELRRVGTGVNHGKRQALAGEETHQGHAALAEADNDAEVVRRNQAHAFLNAASGWQGRSAPKSR